MTITFTLRLTDKDGNFSDTKIYHQLRVDVDVVDETTPMMRQFLKLLLIKLQMRMQHLAIS